MSRWLYKLQPLTFNNILEKDKTSLIAGGGGGGGGGFVRGIHRSPIDSPQNEPIMLHQRSILSMESHQINPIALNILHLSSHGLTPFN